MADRHAFSSLRRLAVPFALLLAALAAPTPAAAEPASFTLRGHGWGHGVGMGQWGAQGFAQQGATYARILSHYYPGTRLAKAQTQTVRVLLQQGRETTRVQAPGGMLVRDETTGERFELGPAETLTVTRKQGALTLTLTGAGPAPLAAGWPGPVVVEPLGRDPLSVLGPALNGTSGRAYRGKLRVLVVKEQLLAVNLVGLDAYVKGVVPMEMPSSWLPAALQAQAVAARSYALATAKPPATPFDQYPDVRSQVYGGIPAEQASTSAAVDATAGLVLYSGVTVATTYFSSSTGGRTASSTDAFLTTKPVSYLISVPDPHDAISPHHDWTVEIPAARMAKALGYAGRVTTATVDAFASGRVRNVILDGTAGPLAVPSGTVRRELGLRSTWFSFGQPLELSAPVVRAGKVRMRATAPAPAVTLQARLRGTWRALETRNLGPNGGAAFTRPLGEAARYRVVVKGGQPSNVVAVSAASGVSLRAPADGTLRGRVWPRLAGRRVALERSTATRWKPVAWTRSAADGSFRFRLPARNGLWRARYGGDAVFRGSVSPEVATGRRKDLARRLAGPGSPTPPSFAPKDPLLKDQWNLGAVRAFDFWPAGPPTFAVAPVIVAVVDGGIDSTNLDLEADDVLATYGQRTMVWKWKQFASVPPKVPKLDHGTAVAGIIAARQDNGFGIAGIDPFVRLLDCRVVGADGRIDPEDEAKAIRWAVDQGARVVNLSLGGTRDPKRRDIDQYSAAEQSAINYAYARGAVIVAATGNSFSPSPFASYPAALPHVLGVSAIGPGDKTPPFSNRDAVYNDIAAPGVSLVSLVSRATTPSGLSVDARPNETVEAGGRLQGTSFAAPHVTAAAALLFAQLPGITNAQVMELLKRSARDVTPATGSPLTTKGPDPLTGYGMLDITEALTRGIAARPPGDRSEPNDTPLQASRRARLAKAHGRLRAVIDADDDPIDAYRVHLRAGQRLTAALEPLSEAGDLDLLLWRPGTRTLSQRRFLAASALTPNARESIGYRARTTGLYTVQVWAPKARTGGQYRLTWNVQPAPGRGGRAGR